MGSGCVWLRIETSGGLLSTKLMTALFPQRAASLLIWANASFSTGGGGLSSTDFVEQLVGKHYLSEVLPAVNIWIMLF